MDDLAKVLTDVVKGSVKADQDILDLCKTMIERIIAIEKRENDFLEAMQVHMDIIKVHTETNNKIREVVKVILSRLDACENNDEVLLTSIVMLKNMVENLTTIGGQKVH